MQEAEVSSLQRLTCHFISQLVPAAREERDNCSISSGASGQIDYYFVSLKRLNNCDLDYATKKNPHTRGGISAHGLFLQVGSLCLNSRDEVRVVSHLLLQSLQEGEICGISRPQTLFILHMIGLQHRVYFVPVPMHRLQTLAHTHQYGYNPSVFLLNQVTDDLVVEELNWLPLGQSSQSINLPSSVITRLLQFVSRSHSYLYSLSFILFLLSLQCELDEKLLQLFIAVVYTELFETDRKHIYICHELILFNIMCKTKTRK